MRKQTKFVLLLVSVSLTAVLLGCGKKEADPLLGRYDAYAVESSGMTLLAPEFLEKESYIELKEKKKAVFAMEGEPQELKWEADGDELTFSDTLDTMEGTVEDGIITLDFAGAKIYFAKGWADTSSIKAKGTEDLFGNAQGAYDLDGDINWGAEEAPEADIAGDTSDSGDTSDAGDASDNSDSEIAENGLKKSATEPSGESGEYISLEDLYRLTNWIHSLEDKPDFDTIVANFGLPTKDCGNNGDDYMSEWGDHYFDWYADKTNLIHVGFRTKDGVNWKICGFNTSGFLWEECENADISGLPGVN